MATLDTGNGTELSKEEAKRLRREEHERNVAAALRRKEEKKANARRQQTEARRALSEQQAESRRRQEIENRRALTEKDSRQISVKINIEEWKKNIKAEYENRYGAVEKCTYNPMTQSFDIVFGNEESAHNAIKAPGPRVGNMPPHTVERKMNRGRCIYFGEPRLLDESVKAMDEHEYNAFRNKVRQVMERYGRLTKYAVVRNAQVVEFEKFENAQQVLEVARTSPVELEIDGVSLMPVFSGLPKRNFEATKRKLQAALENQEEDKAKRQRLEAEQAAGKAAAAAASGGLLPDQATQHYIAGPAWGPPPPGHWGPPPPHGYYGPPPTAFHGPPAQLVQQGGAAGGSKKKKKKGAAAAAAQQQPPQTVQHPGAAGYGPPYQAYYMAYE